MNFNLFSIVDAEARRVISRTLDQSIMATETPITREQKLEIALDTYTEAVDAYRDLVDSLDSKYQAAEDLIAVLEKKIQAQAELIEAQSKLVFTVEQIDQAVRVGYLTALTWSANNIRGVEDGKTSDERIQDAVGIVLNRKRNGTL